MEIIEAYCLVQEGNTPVPGIITGSLTKTDFYRTFGEAERISVPSGWSGRVQKVHFLKSGSDYYLLSKTDTTLVHF